MPHEKLIVRGAREHNLKDITIEIPRDKLVVITGLSGSGKTLLARHVADGLVVLPVDILRCLPWAQPRST